MVIDEVAVMLFQFAGGDEPCNFNSMDEYVFDDEWCEANCTEHDARDCWRHAIEAKWHERVWADVPKKAW